MATRTFLLHVKSLLASPWRYLAARAHLAALGDQHARWADLGNFDPAWDGRTALIASLVAPGSSVLEFGSGREQLEKFLPSGCAYQPCDIVARSSRTLVCDLNVAFPNLDRRYDVVVFSGVLEYIHDLPALLREVRSRAGSCILSYMPTDALDCIATRMRSGWVHHYSIAALEVMCVQAGFRVERCEQWQGHHIVKLV